VLFIRRFPLFHCGQELSTGLLAATAGFEADPAMRVMRRMLLALVGAGFASGRARLQEQPGDIGVALGLAACDPDGRATDVGTVQTQTNALDEVGPMLLSQISVCVRDASLKAVAERVYGCGE
jgi:hypothetical protein